jgi:hypothetical protein
VVLVCCAQSLVSAHKIFARKRRDQLEELDFNGRIILK